MARKRIPNARREDWHGEEIALADGRAATHWRNLVTGEEATLITGTHPMDNQNAVALVPSMPAPDVDEPDDGSEDEPEMTAADRVAALLRRVGDSPEGKASVRLYRIKDDSKTLSWCANYSPTAFEEGDLEMIRKQWGPGRYEIRLYAANPTTGKWGVRAAERLELEAPAATADAAPVGDPALAAVLMKMNERLDAVSAVLSAAPRVDAMEQMRQTLGLVSAMREAFGANQQPREQSPGSAMREIMQTIQAMKMIRTEIEPPAEPSDPLAASLPKLLEIIGAASRQPPQQPLPALNVPASMHAPAPAVAPISAPVSAPVAANESEDQMQIAFTSAVTLLNMKAATNADTDESAELIYDNAPDDLFEILRAENWFETLAHVAPSIAPFREWYTRVRDRVLAIDAEESRQEASTTPAVKSA
jgi:hypothetical protein